MSTHQEVQARLSYSRAMLERDVRVSSIATLISAKFSVSRSTAYNDITAAQAELKLSDDGPSIEESSEPVSTDNVLALLQHRFEISVATGDDKATCSIVKAMDQVKRWNGYNTQSASPFA
tara:strand:+ start:160 stop:519 length:360 start_codon:yes stop_codon:yes gene_type:complete